MELRFSLSYTRDVLRPQNCSCPEKQDTVVLQE
jgi:hypothetical protein